MRLAAVVATLALALLVTSVVSGRLRDDGAGAAAETRSPMVDRAELRSVAPPGPLLVRAIDERAPLGDGRLVEVSASGLAKPVGRLECKRVHMAAGRGLCTGLDANGIDYQGVVFDARYRATRRFAVEGVPDRVRVSADGRYGAYTSFDDRGSVGYFAGPSAFTTYTRIVDLKTGAVLLRLEDLRVSHEGRRLDVSDANLWGVTFADDGGYYATLALGGSYFLIEGDVEHRRAQTVREGIECPALSPDGGRIAYKRRIGDSNRWRFHVLDLATGRDLALAERRSIDDQPEWLDDDTVVYSDDRDVFAVPADGGGAPVRIARRASSPVSLGALARR